MDQYNCKSKLSNQTKNPNKNVDNLSNSNKNICIYSYNSRGFDIIKQKFCMELLNMNKDTIPILCNQENFVLKGNGHIIRNAIENFHVFIKPATKDYFDGRPINGMFIALPRHLKNRAKDVSPNSKRVQAIILETEEDSLMIINVYFPQDPKTKMYNLDADLEDVLATIETVIQSHQCNSIVITGDLNTDYRRHNGRVKRFQTFLSNNSLESSWNTFEANYTHEFEMDNTTYTSTIDHVLWNINMSKNVLDAGVLHLPGNTSDHSPIYCNVQKICSTEELPPVINRNHSISTKMLEENDWGRFNTELDFKLQNVKVPNCLDCRNVHCRNVQHIHEIDEYVTNILEAIDGSIKFARKTKRNNITKDKIMPGWSDIVKPFRDDAIFWNAIWTSAGKPINTNLHHIMKRTRNIYHYAIRKCKRATDCIKKDKLLNSCLAGKNNIFDEIRKMRSVRNNAPKSIDGSEKPAERFAEVYGELYNSVDDALETRNLFEQVETCIDANSLHDVDLITADVIADVVKDIKSNKSDPEFCFNSDCIKRAPATLYVHISKFIKSFLIHGHVSNILLVATIIPLIKNKLDDIESSDNYRSIAISSVVLKIFDWIVMTLFGQSLDLDELQFSYQKNCSTTMCTWLVVETISYFSRNNSDVCTCFMDMRKAFDTVKHSTLFGKLIKRNVPPIYLRLLLVMYMSQTAKVRWEGTVSDAFSILNGVKQGAVLSAILFCVYIDDLIKELRKNRDGCWLNGEFVGIIVYADDIVLLSPSLDGLQNMIDTCSRYAKSHNLSFSTHENPTKSKTKCIAFQRTKKDLKHRILNGKKLPWVTTVKHLGTTITDDVACKLNQDLLEKRAQYISKNNELVQEFHYAHPSTKIWVNHIYNTCFYGSPLWDMFSRNFEKLEKSWNVSQRIMLAIPRTAHRYFIEPLSDRAHIIKSLKKRFLNFVLKIKKSNKAVLRNVLNVIELDCRSTTGRNLRKLKLFTKNYAFDDINPECYPYIETPVFDKWRISLVKEIIEIKSNRLKLGNLSHKDLDDITELVCSS